MLEGTPLKHAQPRLSPGFLPFLVMISCYVAVTTVHSTFLSTFLLHATGSAKNVKIFNIILAACQPFSMIGALVLVRKFSAIFSQQVGLGLMCLTNLYLFVAIESAAAHIYLVSAAQSIANGFYYTTYACQYVAYTTNENRDRASGIASLVANLLSLGVSMGSSVLFSLRPGYPGYRILFLFALAVSLGALAASFRLPKLTTVSAGRKIYYLHAAKILLGNRYARSSMLVALIDGMRLGVTAFLLNVLLYSLVSSESLVGLNTFLSALSGILAFALYARVVRVNNRYRSAQMGILALMAATALLLRMTPATIILYGCISAFATAFYSTPFLNAYWTVLEKLPELDLCRPETHAVREYFCAGGRVLGILLTMLLPATPAGSALALFLITAVQYGALLLSRGIMRDLDGQSL